VVVVATAGWSIPRSVAAHFPGAGSHLQRYSRVLRGVEINTSFYRDHSHETYAHWAAQTPRGFRFAVKVPRAITHDARLRGARRPLEQFLLGVRGLGARLGPLIVQLPGSQLFEPRVASRFFDLLRERYDGAVVCEPRHASWFEPVAERLLVRQHVGRIAADPAVVPDAAHPGGWPGIVYYRLHGAPRKYWSVYEPDRVLAWCHALTSLPRRTSAWCVFDNTAGGGAAGNALQMTADLEGRDVRRRQR
jgi:uncharacterized protein YecE (DUF72 family)